MTTGVVVPIRAFADGKSRLAPYLPPDERARLMAAMAERVVRAAGPCSVAVVSSAPEVIDWAAGLDVPVPGVTVLDDPGTLDGAAAAGHDHFAGLGIERVLIAHADLPLVESLARLTEVAGGDAARRAVLVPCHHDDGTPLLSIPTGAGFEFSYGPGSFARHVVEARRVGLDVVELRDDPRLRHDVDSYEDLAVLSEGAG